MLAAKASTADLKVLLPSLEKPKRHAASLQASPNTGMKESLKLLMRSVQTVSTASPNAASCASANAAASSSLPSSSASMTA